MIPLYLEQLDSINERLTSVNKLWQAQQTGGTYMDFPDAFKVRSEHGDYLGKFEYDQCESWIFCPATLEENEADRKERAKKVQPPF